MKVGAENRNKLIAAVVLGVVAIILLVRFIPTVAGSSPTPEVRAFSGGVRTPDEGVSFTEAVRAFEPAAADPDDAKEEKAGVAVAPVDVFAWT